MELLQLAEEFFKIDKAKKPLEAQLAMLPKEQMPLDEFMAALVEKGKKQRSKKA